MMRNWPAIISLVLYLMSFSLVAFMSFLYFDTQCLITICLAMFFFVFTLLEVLWLSDPCTNVFHKFCKIIIIQVLFFSFLLFSSWNINKPSPTESSYSVIVFPVFQVRKFLLSCLWLGSLIFSFMFYITDKPMGRSVHLQCSIFHF